MIDDIKERYTTGNSFRAKAEAHQRHYRAQILNIPYETWGHILGEKDANTGKNFVNRAAFKAAEDRKTLGKGIAARTFNNMLSSQAMCFNMFTLLDQYKSMAVKALEPFFPSLYQVDDIIIEHTPSVDIFGDQSEVGGVDCDVLLHGKTEIGRPIIIVLETKYVEREFSTCGFRRKKRKLDQQNCPENIELTGHKENCLYKQKKQYKYWERTERYALLKPDALPERGCPFSGPLWQLWVNFTLAHAEAERADNGEAYFGIIAPHGNKELLTGDGSSGTIADFKRLLQHPEKVVYIDSDRFILSIQELAKSVSLDVSQWADSLASRYILT